MSKYLRSKDEVIVISGNDKGKVGKILAIKDDRVIVEGINLRKKHLRRTQENQKGQIIDIECPIHISNVRPSVDGKPIKLRVRKNNKGEREQYYYADKKAVAFRSTKKKKGT